MTPSVGEHNLVLPQLFSVSLEPGTEHPPVLEEFLTDNSPLSFLYIDMNVTELSRSICAHDRWQQAPWPKNGKRKGKG